MSSMTAKDVLTSAREQDVKFVHPSSQTSWELSRESPSRAISSRGLSMQGCGSMDPLSKDLPGSLRVTCT